MENALAALSEDLARAVERAGQAVVAVHGRQRIPSSGVHWRPGVIVTAEHALRRDEEISITLPDGRNVPAALAGRDAGTDLAVLKADGLTLPTAPAADGGTLRPGQIVVAVGRSPQAGANAAMGVIGSVSGPWRTWRGGHIDRFVALDLTVYPGSSGAAVVDTEGRLLGLATSGLSRFTGIAIPLSTIDRVAGELLRTGRVARGYLGVGLQPVPLPEHLKNSLGIAQPNGVIILTVEPDSPAARAGALMGDVIVALDGRPIGDTDDVQAALGPDSVGRTLRATVIRGGTLADLAFTIGERPRKEH